MVYLSGAGLPGLSWKKGRMYVYVKVPEDATKPRFFRVLSSQKPRFATTTEGFQANPHYYIHLTASFPICLPKCYNCTDEFGKLILAG